MSDIGLLHIQDILLSNLAARENASKGLAGLGTSCEGKENWGMSEDPAKDTNNEIEETRRETVEMLEMLHSDFVDVVKKGNNDNDSVKKSSRRIF